jgi:hypothetical protein
VVAASDNWDAPLAPIFVQAGASTLGADSRDAAVVVTVAAGRNYTVIVRAGGGGDGEAMLEIFELP